MKELMEYLNMMNGLCANDGMPYSTIEDFVLANGQSFVTKTHEDLAMRELKLCFMNAMNLAIESAGELCYVEGYALKPGLIPIHHAWCVDENDCVYDNTWRDIEGSAYYGVKFNIEYVLMSTLTSGYYGVIDRCEVGFPILRGEHDTEQWRDGKYLDKVEHKHDRHV